MVPKRWGQHKNEDNLKIKWKNEDNLIKLRQPKNEDRLKNKDDFKHIYELKHKDEFKLENKEHLIKRKRPTRRRELAWPQLF